MMRSFVFTACCLALIAQASAEKPFDVAPPESQDMQVLFDGKSLDGWDGDDRLWQVKDGVIHGETTADLSTKGNTFLIWKDPAKDFELRLSFRCNATNNSGIQYRSEHLKSGRKASNNWVLRGYQHEIRNENTLPSVPGFIYDEKGSRGRICLVGEKAVWDANGKKVDETALITADEFSKLMKLDDWNDVVIIAKGSHIRHYLNGRLILDFTDEEPTKAFSEGRIGLQLHAGKPMWAEFKDIRMRAL